MDESAVRSYSSVSNTTTHRPYACSALTPPSAWLGERCPRAYSMSRKLCMALARCEIIINWTEADHQDVTARSHLAPHGASPLSYTTRKWRPDSHTRDFGFGERRCTHQPCSAVLSVVAFVVSVTASPARICHRLPGDDMTSALTVSSLRHFMALAFLVTEPDIAQSHCGTDAMQHLLYQRRSTAGSDVQPGSSTVPGWTAHALQKSIKRKAAARSTDGSVQET